MATPHSQSHLLRGQHTSTYPLVLPGETRTKQGPPSPGGRRRDTGRLSQPDTSTPSSAAPPLRPQGPAISRAHVWVTSLRGAALQNSSHPSAPGLRRPRLTSGARARAHVLKAGIHPGLLSTLTGPRSNRHGARAVRRRRRQASGPRAGGAAARFLGLGRQPRGRAASRGPTASRDKVPDARAPRGRVPLQTPPAARSARPCSETLGLAAAPGSPGSPRPVPAPPRPVPVRQTPPPAGDASAARSCPGAALQGGRINSHPEVGTTGQALTSFRHPRGFSSTRTRPLCKHAAPGEQRPLQQVGGQQQGRGQHSCRVQHRGGLVQQEDRPEAVHRQAGDGHEGAGRSGPLLGHLHPGLRHGLLRAQVQINAAHLTVGNDQC